MRTITERITESLAKTGADGEAAGATLTLTYDLRSKSRLRAELDGGVGEVAVVLPRGHRLNHGDILVADDGLRISVVAADEPTSTATAVDGLLLAKACYHLGNRHVALQIGAGWARYQHDHVLDEMVRGLGLQVSVGQTPFEPEGGAYGEGGHLAGGHRH